MPSQKNACHKNWRKAYGPDEVIQRIRPEESFEELRNPHRGTTTFQCFEGDPPNPGLKWTDTQAPTKFSLKPQRPRGKLVYPKTTVAYMRWLWVHFENQKGKYHWKVLDQALKTARERGQTLQVRIQPYVGTELPKYLYDEIKVWQKPIGHPGQEPSMNDKAYIRAWTNLIRSMGERYDGHPDLESVDLVFGGHCGEHGGDASVETSRHFVKTYFRAFKKTRLVSMLGTKSCVQASKMKLDHSWRADCIGDLRNEGGGVVPDSQCFNHMFDDYPRLIHTEGVKEVWKRAPVTFETCWVVGHWFKKDWDFDFIISQTLKYHPSLFMPKQSAYPRQVAEKMAAFDRRLGYRFVLRQCMLPLKVKRSKAIEFKFYIDNVGVAPIYRRYPMALRFSCGGKSKIVPLKVDISKWEVDINWFSERVALPSGWPAKDTCIDVGILDPKLKKPKVLFANKGRDNEGWLPLTCIEVE